jgi:hypothetical protein
MSFWNKFREWLSAKTDEPTPKIDLTLKRIVENQDGIFGVLLQGEKPLCLTLENNWFNNTRNISAIPTGVYECVPHNGAKYKNVWRLKDVPNRSAILIHAGNIEDDSRGCILVGSEFGLYKGKKAILGSVKALNKLRGRLPSNFTLRVTDG